MPKHVALIMDGNGRWAGARGLPRIRGHERGAQTLREIVRHLRSCGVEEATFYALSTENYRKRPRLEVRQLLALLRDYLIGERQELLDQDIQFRAIGRTEEFPARVLKELQRTTRETAHCQSMILRLALNYGARSEIVDAIRDLAGEVARGERSIESVTRLDEAEFAQHLYDPEMSDPDLLIRTGGDFRVSNFLLWQISYSEMWVSESGWPDFTTDDVDIAFDAFRGRERRFGTAPVGSGPTVSGPIGSESSTTRGRARLGDAESGG